MNPLPNRLIATSLDKVDALLPEFRYQGDGVWDDSNSCFVYGAAVSDLALTYGFRKRVEQIVEVDDVIISANRVNVIVADSSRVLNPDSYLDHVFYVYELDTALTEDWFEHPLAKGWWCNRAPQREFVSVNALSIRDFLDGRRLTFEFNWFRQPGSALW